MINKQLKSSNKIRLRLMIDGVNYSYNWYTNNTNDVYDFVKSSCLVHGIDKNIVRYNSKVSYEGNYGLYDVINAICRDAYNYKYKKVMRSIFLEDGTELDFIFN